MPRHRLARGCVLPDSPCSPVRTQALTWRVCCSLVVWGVWYRISNSQANSTFLDLIEPYINMTGAVRAFCLLCTFWRTDCHVRVSRSVVAVELGCTVLPWDGMLNKLTVSRAAWPCHRTRRSTWPTPSRKTGPM